MFTILNNIETIISTNPGLAFLGVFIGGLLTASNPCVLIMVPLAIGFVGGNQEPRSISRAFFFSLIFVLGLAITFSILGIIAVLTGRMFGDVGSFWKYIVSGVCLVAGIEMLGLVKFNLPLPQIIPKKRNILGAFLFGLLFGLVSTPCAAPILVVLLTFIASKGNLLYGAILLLFYALGHCVLILIAGTSAGLASSILESKGLTRFTNYLRKTAGLILILFGIYILI